MIKRSSFFVSGFLLVLVFASSFGIRSAAARTWVQVNNGDSGVNVYTVQALLKQRGYSLDVNGDFGAQTLATVKRFQGSKRLTKDGIVGPNTWEKLVIETNQGDANIVVKALQKQLNKHGASLTVDGEFGAATLAAVKSFQGRKGMTQDGRVGADTWAALTGNASSDGASLARNCAIQPSSCGYPDATNSGIPAGTILRRVPQDITSGNGWYFDQRGWITVNGNGAVLENIDTAVGVDVTANNVTIRNSRIRFGGEGWAIGVRHGANVVIRNNELGGLNTGAGRMLVAVKDIYGDATAMQVIGNNIMMVSTGIQIDAGLIEDNYIHDMGYVSGDHINGTTSNASHGFLTIRHNTIFNQFEQTDAISLFEDFGVQKDRLIHNNLMAGGGYCLYAGQNAGGLPTSNITVTNNRFSRHLYANCGAFGPVAAWFSGGGNVWSGNIWDDTGVAVTP